MGHGKQRGERRPGARRPTPRPKQAGSGADLERLVAELSAAAAGAGSGAALPTVSADQAVALAAALAEEFDRGVARRATLAAEAGHTIYCRAGCQNCCEIMVMAYHPEVEAIVRYLQAPEQAEVLGRFRAAYAVWRDAVGEVPERLTRLFVEGPPAAYDRLHMEQWGRRVRCAFNHEGRCSIYPVRPLACRNAHALDTDARCVADSPEPAQAVQFIPLDNFLRQATRLLRTAHNAAGRPRDELQAVCAAVHEALS